MNDNDGGDTLDLIANELAANEEGDVEEIAREESSGIVDRVGIERAQVAAEEGGVGMTAKAAVTAKRNAGKMGAKTAANTEGAVQRPRKVGAGAAKAAAAGRTAGRTSAAAKTKLGQVARRGRRKKDTESEQETDEDCNFDLETTEDAGLVVQEEGSGVGVMEDDGGERGVDVSAAASDMEAGVEVGGAKGRPRREGLRTRVGGKRKSVEEDDEEEKQSEGGDEEESGSDFSDGSEDEEFVTPSRAPRKPPVAAATVAAKKAAVEGAEVALVVATGESVLAAVEKIGAAAGKKGASKKATAATKPRAKKAEAVAKGGKFTTDTAGPEASKQPPAKRAASTSRGGKMSAAAAAAGAAKTTASAPLEISASGPNTEGRGVGGGGEKRPSSKQLAYLVVLKCPDQPATMAECSVLIEKYKAIADGERQARYVAAFDADADAAAHAPLVQEKEEPRKHVTNKELRASLHNVFGHKDFRSGQEDALTRVLKGQSTLLISATGGGKSLCFQLPACHLGGPILVVSPLLSLIADQLEHLPPGITGATLNSSQTHAEQLVVVQGLKEAKIHVLFIAPERLMTDSFVSLARSIPPFKLACVDEAHCVSEWAHNFRPSYLRLKSILQGALRITTILALTATATRAMEKDILVALGIPQEGVIRAGLLRPNLHMSVSNENERQQSLLNLLDRDARFKTGSVIVYCSLRAQCQTMANFLSTHSIQADYYHAGRSVRDRQRIQTKFMIGKLRVVVATVAFGMGIDKQDVRGVVHYNCPNSIEAYVQEVGRAGRDGRNAYCHLFFDDADLARLRNYAYAEGVDSANIKVLVEAVLLETPARRRPAGAFAGIKVDDEKKYDMSKESMAAIFSFLEQDGTLATLNESWAEGVLSFIKDNQADLQSTSQIVDAILKTVRATNGQWKFSPADIASLVGRSPREVMSELRSLAARKQLRVDFNDKAFVCKILDDTCEIELVIQRIVARFASLETRRARRVDALGKMLAAAVSTRPQFPSSLQRGGVADGGSSAGGAPKKDIVGTDKAQQDTSSTSKTSQKDASESGHVGGVEAELQGKILSKALNDYFEEEEEEEVVAEETTAAQKQQQLGQNRFLRADVISFVNRYAFVLLCVRTRLSLLFSLCIYVYIYIYIYMYIFIYKYACICKCMYVCVYIYA